MLVTSEGFNNKTVFVKSLFLQRKTSFAGVWLVLLYSFNTALFNLSVLFIRSALLATHFLTVGSSR